MKETSPTEAKKAAEWMKYRDGAHYANVEGLIHALGLHRDPTRGRTHIVFLSLKYTPKASDDVRYKLSVIQAGVFKLTDVYIDIEKIMRLNRGEGKEYVDGLLAELDSVLGDNVPILDLMSCGDLQPWLRNPTIPRGGLRQLPYNPNWRQSMNTGDPVKPMALVSGAKDAEKVC